MASVNAELVRDLVRMRGKNGRCRYNQAAKRELVRRCLQPGVSLAATALAHGVNANLLRKWVATQSDSARTRAAARSLASAGTVLLPVRIAEQGAHEPHAPPTKGYIEILLGGAAVRVHGRVDADSLRRVLDCVARRT